MEVLLGTLLSYFISLAANERSSAIHKRREKTLAQELAKEEQLREALASRRSIRGELRSVCVELTRNRARLGVTPQEEPLWRLLSEDLFQSDLADWLMAGGIEEGRTAKAKLMGAMEFALASRADTDQQIAFLKNGYFEELEKAVFAHSILAHWRHQLSLDYLREQVAVLRQRAEEAAGVYSPDKQEAALNHYCEMALEACDIIDLSSLPEGDVQITTQQLLLRQLYMPLRIEVEPTKRGEDDDAALARLEEHREARRHREAGHLFVDEPDRSDHRVSRSPVGERLGVSRRLVVLGDPGGGKTTMLRWMATAYLLRYKGDSSFSQVPDTDTLPSQSWIPVFIRCRDLGEEDLCRCFTDFLTQHLNKTELLPTEANIMRSVILDRIAKGEALLLVDGLDEITNPHVRMMFCQELECTAARYPNAPIVVTSRIVGYRDMPYRMGSGFEHGVIAELNRDDKDLFARRWVDVTEQHQSSAEKGKRAQELLDALHSSDRIERLTGNPMLLTTLALVKRKVGKLPNRRTKLYAEAVSVLLNWNPRRYQIIEEDEAIPQLEYLAYEMCRRGVQQLTDNEVLELLYNLRNEYPTVRAVRSREPREFLKHLEERSSILIKSGGVWQKNKTHEKPVWEFRHLTFQEYLAARAIHDGKYPNRGKPKSLAEQVAPLAGAVEKAKRRRPVSKSKGEIDVPESWREALRLLVADCKDDDVDEVLLKILNPMADEDPSKTSRPRAVLATLCLADEPNVSEENAQHVLSVFAAKVGDDDGTGQVSTSLDQAAIEVGSSMWLPLLKKSFIQEFCGRPPHTRWNVGGIWAMVEVACLRKPDIDSRTFFSGLVQCLRSSDRIEVISAALIVMEAAYKDSIEVVQDLPDSLLDLVTSEDLPARFSAAWALGWLSIGSPFNPERKPAWVVKGDNVVRVAKALEATDASEHSTSRWLARVLGSSQDSRALPALINQLDHPNAVVRQAVAESLVTLGHKQAVPPLLAKLNDPDTDMRQAVIQSLGQLGDKQAVPPLLAKLDDSDADVRRTVIRALGQLGDKQAVPPLLAKLDDSDAYVRRTVVRALGELGDKQAVPSLLAKLDDSNIDIVATIAVTLCTLGEPKGMTVLIPLLTSDRIEVRQTAVRAYAENKDTLNRQLLSSNLDAIHPWIDPREPVTEAQVIKASHQFNITPEQVRSRFEVMAPDLNLILSWKN